ncbi:protein TolQ [Alphaproteobacteria bacterium]|jgi:biopolymer transport protein TolQ|nr:protein TolQ [Alphaproteobacteria bacterium]
MESVETVVTHSGADMSIMGLFFAADPLVKLVMLLLLAASICCWAIVVDKVRAIRRERRYAQNFEDAFWSGGSLDELYDETGADPDDAISRVFVAAMREWRRATARGLASTSRSDLRASLVGRIDRSMNFTITREMERLERGMNLLASIGSVSPFIGLLGTVWGIMSSFQSIAESKNTSLAVVAPGIAEALFATALGLAAAIPAVIAYNKFAGDLERLGARFETFAQEFSTLLARQLDEGGS